LQRDDADHTLDRREHARHPRLPRVLAVDEEGARARSERERATLRSVKEIGRMRRIRPSHELATRGSGSERKSGRLVMLASCLGWHGSFGGAIRFAMFSSLVSQTYSGTAMAAMPSRPRCQYHSSSSRSPFRRR
jgi:hypothetical protein